MTRALFEILLYVVGVWHGTQLAKVLWNVQPRSAIPRCPPACSEMHTFEPGCLQHIDSSDA
jgi:hypothetical protein